MMEQMKPMDIEKRSFAIITELLGDRRLDPENELVIKRVIHTAAAMPPAVAVSPPVRAPSNPFSATACATPLARQ